MALEYNRQYIGARYVPQFFKNPNGSWDWAQGFQYEPLTMVKYSENTYTSRKLVPSNIGAPNLNPEYWANTGNYNGAIYELTQQINSLIADVSKNTQWIEGFPLRVRKIAVMGDSYANSAYGYGFAQYLQPILDSLYPGSTIYERSGYGFVGNTGTWISALQDIDLTGVTDFYLVGGANDINKQNVAQNVNGVCNFFKSKNINFTYIPVGINLKSRAASLTSYITICNAMLNNGYPVIDKAITWLDDRSLLETDGIHPTDIGSINLAKRIACVIMGHGSSNLYTTTLNNVNVNRSDFIKTLYMNKTFQYETPQNITTGTAFLLIPWDELPSILNYTKTFTWNGTLYSNGELYDVDYGFTNQGLTVISQKGTITVSNFLVAFNTKLDIFEV